MRQSYIQKLMAWVTESHVISIALNELKRFVVDPSNYDSHRGLYRLSFRNLSWTKMSLADNIYFNFRIALQICIEHASVTAEFCAKMLKRYFIVK